VGTACGESLGHASQSRLTRQCLTVVRDCVEVKGATCKQGVSSVNCHGHCLYPHLCVHQDLYICFALLHPAA
jgi:hypothetical protein